MSKLLSILSFPLLLICLALAAVEFYSAILWAVKHLAVYKWVGAGMGVYLLLRLLPFLNKNTEWFETQTHEWLHTIVALMFGQKIHSVSAGERDGVMYHSGHFTRNIFISLAPYCLPLYTYVFCVLRLLSAKQTLYIFDLLIGLTAAFHFVAFKKQTKSYQPDII
jgi:hypothetical protein